MTIGLKRPFALTKVSVQLPKILTRLFWFGFAKRGKRQVSYVPARVRSNGDTVCRRSLDISSIKFVVSNPFQCEIIPIAYFFRQMIPEAEVSKQNGKQRINSVLQDNSFHS